MRFVGSEEWFEGKTGPAPRVQGWGTGQLAPFMPRNGALRDGVMRDGMTPQNDDDDNGDMTAMATDLHQAQKIGRRVLIVFADAPDKWLLRVLPAAFRHCFAVLETGEAGCWIYLNPASHQLECMLWRFSALFDPAAYYRARGHRCLWVTLPRGPLPRLRLGVASCVGVIKHLLGISAWWVITPGGLYRYLVNRSKIYQKSS